MDDDAILAELRAGGPDAVRALHAAYGAAVFEVVQRRTGDVDRSREIVHEVLATVWREAPRFDPRHGTLRAWVFRLALEAQPATAGDDVVDAVLHETLVRAALDRIPAEHRVVVDLVHGRGLTVAQAAAELGVPEATVRSRCFYALKNLRTAFQELGVVPGDL